MAGSLIAREWLSPPQLARELGVKPGKVLAWVRAGELRAVDMAQNRGGRPRYRIARRAVDAFLAARAAVPHVAPSPRRRRRRNSQITEFF